MERLHKEIGEIKEERHEEAGEAWKRIMINNQQFSIPAPLLALLEDGKE
jgi:hypothetical protein